MASDNKVYNSVDVAKYIAAAANEKDNMYINMTKIQKLLYVAYGIYLAVTGRRLVDEHPQAWPYGPVFPNARIGLLNENLNALTFKNVNQDLVDDQTLKKLIDLVLKHFGNFSAAKLTAWTHVDGSPWQQVVNQSNYGTEIPDDIIKSFFKYKVIKKKN